jgi:hypothetical protein
MTPLFVGLKEQIPLSEPYYKVVCLSVHCCYVTNISVSVIYLWVFMGILLVMKEPCLYSA